MDLFTKELGQFCENLEVLFAVQDLCLSSSPHNNRAYPHHPTHTQSSSPSNIPLQSFPPDARPNRTRPPPSPTSSMGSLSPSPSYNGSERGGRDPFARLRETLFFSNPQDKQFIVRAVTSHLQTHGSTVVTGPDVDLVNMYVESKSEGWR